MTAVVITAALFFCNITPLKNAAKDSLPCPDNTNKFILFWVKWTVINNQQHSQHSYMLSRYKILGFFSAIFNSGLYVDSDSSILIYSKVSSYICSFIAHLINSETIDFRQPHEPINTILISLSFSRLIALITSPVNARVLLYYTLHTILQSSRAVFPELYLVT